MVHGIGSAATRSISINRDTLEQRRMVRDIPPLSNTHIYIHIHARSFVIIALKLFI